MESVATRSVANCPCNADRSVVKTTGTAVTTRPVIQMPCAACEPDVSRATVPATSTASVMTAQVIRAFMKVVIVINGVIATDRSMLATSVFARGNRLSDPSAWTALDHRRTQQLYATGQRDGVGRSPRK